MTKKAVLLYFLMSLMVGVSFGQQISDRPLGAWYMYFGKFQLADKWSLHNETQWRQHQVVGDFQQSLSRIGLNYHIDPAHMITGGYGFIRTQVGYDYDNVMFAPNSFFTNEHRIWQQFVHKHHIGKLFLDQRYRLEQRFVSAFGETNYSNRARFKVGAGYPLNNESIKAETWYLYAYDEAFININDTPFSQNRLYGALGYKVNEVVNIQAGYLWWYTDRLNNRLQVALFFSPDFRKPTDPTPMD